MVQCSDGRVSFPLPKPDPKGRTIFLFRVGQYDPARFKLQDLLKLNYINMDIVLKVRRLSVASRT